MTKKILTLAALICFIVSASAQDAFKSLAIGLELGTTGVGVELAMPVVSNHLVIKAGFNAPTIAHNYTNQLDISTFNDEIANVNNSLQSIGAVERIQSSFSPAEYKMTPMLNLSTAKLMLEWYPFKKGSFHLTLGAYYGMSDNFVAFNTRTSDTFYSEYNAFRDEVNALNEKYSSQAEFNVPDFKDFSVVIDGKSFAVSETDGKFTIDMSLKVAKIRPYLGFGFGRSVPNSRFGFQFDLGVWYHGTPSVVSTNPKPGAYTTTIDSGYDIWSTVEMVKIYPQLSFRLTYKIF